MSRCPSYRSTRDTVLNGQPVEVEKYVSGKKGLSEARRPKPNKNLLKSYSIDLYTLFLISPIILFKNKDKPIKTKRIKNSNKTNKKKNTA